MKNPIAISSNCPQGQKLPADWQRQAKANAAQAEAAYLDRLQNAWKGAGVNGQRYLPPMQAARLRQDSGHCAHHPHHRFDGEMELVEERADGMQLWRDKASGTMVWRRLQWADVVGRR